jgi:hypothetical protein
MYLDTRLKIFDFSQTEFGDSITTGYRFNSAGLDVLMQYRLIRSFWVFGGPGFGVNFHSSVGVSTGGKKIEYNKINSSIKKNVGLSVVVGGMYKMHLTKKASIQPFVFARLPLNSVLRIEHFKNKLFTIDVGASYIMGRKKLRSRKGD